MNAKSTWLILAAFASAVIFAGPARAANVSVTLSNVHICCDSCLDGISDVIATVKGASEEADKNAKTITVTASDNATLQKAVDALVAAGFFGVSNNPSIKVAAPIVDDATVSSLKVSGVHLCCKKCVTAVNKAVSKVQGVTGTTAAKEAKSFEITGQFNAKDVVAALNSAGFSARVEP